MLRDGCVIRDSNRTIKMVGSRHLGNASIIIAKCLTLRDGVIAKNQRLFKFGN